jgi:hypothetical protein
MSFDYAKPFDIMTGYWVGTASIYGPHGVYLMSTKSYVSVYWKDDHTLSFRESAEDAFRFQGRPQDYIRPRGGSVVNALNGAGSVTASGAARVMTYDFKVNGPYCETTGPSDPVFVTGRQTRPDAYQFHVKMKKDHDRYHHAYNSHHLPTPDDWHIIGPIVGRVKKTEGEVGLSVVQFFRRISYDVPAQSVRPIR